MTNLDNTLKYYAVNTDEFIASTLEADMSVTQEKFLSLLPKGASILDLGCGSGRDSLCFLQKDFQVTAVDGSEERDIVLKTPNGEIPFKVLGFLTGFALPNFLFHVTTAYAILRHNGVPIGKLDFLGRG